MSSSVRLAELPFPGSLPACSEEQRRRQPQVPVALARGADRGSIAIEGAFGSARLSAADPVAYGLEPSCVAAWSTTVCDASTDAWPQVTLAGDLRSGVATFPLAPDRGHQRFRLACAPP